MSVVICAYTEDRWDQLCDAAASAAGQEPPPLEVIVVSDHNPALAARAGELGDDVTVIENAHRQGLSGARNSGTEAARGEIVAFLDDDAVAAPGWLAALAGQFGEPDVVAAGGEVRPRWTAGAPDWFPNEFLWVVGCTHSGMPDRPSDVRNVVGANMAFRRDALLTLGGFHEDVGRVGTLPEGCEETELCIRAQQQIAGARVRYDPAAAVDHVVPPQRATWDYFASRCRAEGRSKAIVSQLVGAQDGLAEERRYTRETLPRGAWAGLADTFRGDASGLGRSAAIVAGLLTTAFGYGSARVRRGRR
ncbi:MAG: glycosyltransferase [Baekduia sp.]